MRTKAFFNFELIIRKLKRQRKIGRWGLLRNVQTAFDLAFPKRSVEIGAPNRKKTAVEIASVNPEVRLRIRLADSGGQYFVDRHEDGNVRADHMVPALLFTESLAYTPRR